MQTNVTLPDRLVRLVVAGLILGLYGALPAPWRYLTLLGLIPLGTALTGFCPFYAAVGWNRQSNPKGSENRS